MTRDLSAELGLNAPAEIQVVPSYVQGAVATFVGNACEVVRRNLGRPVQVAPFLEFPGELKAWLSFYEAWAPAERANLFMFSHVSLTVFFGYVGESLKPQIFRCEWSGVRDWTGSGHSFQTQGAGHPHWQFDLSETIRRKDPKFAAEHALIGADQEFLASHSSVDVEEFEAAAAPIEEFTAEVARPDIYSMVAAATLERLHFASAAPWWERPRRGWPVHLNAPEDQAALSRWLISSVAYMRQELGRCSFDHL